MPAARKRPPVRIDVVRRIDELLEVWSVRSLVYMAEQNCPYDEEFDGNDLAAATHLLARIGNEPVATMRIRWFAAFAKIERVAVRPGHRSGEISAALVRAALDHAARKGHTKVIGHIQKRLLRYWRRSANVRVREGRPEFHFSGYDYVEIEKELTPPPNAIGLNTPAMIVLRPEGDWDRPGILERSAKLSGAGKGPVR